MPVCNNGDRCRLNQQGKCKWYHPPQPVDVKVEIVDSVPKVKPKKTLEEKVKKILANEVKTKECHQKLECTKYSCWWKHPTASGRPVIAEIILKQYEEKQKTPVEEVKGDINVDSVIT